MRAERFGSYSIDVIVPTHRRPELVRLLKDLTRITEPTRGYADLRGRMGSLLEVGTGFHPELTGRENIFQSTRLLGFPEAYVRARLPEILGVGVETL